MSSVLIPFSVLIEEWIKDQTFSIAKFSIVKFDVLMTEEPLLINKSL